MSLAEAVAQIEELKVHMQSIIAAFREQMEYFYDELTLFKRAIQTNDSITENRRVKVPEPKPFAGARNAKELENFLWDMEQYFSAAHIPIKKELQSPACTCLAMVDDDLSAGCVPITTWESLRKELIDQFLPCNVAWVAHETL
ncbi:hypothetical protein CKAN_02666700 [Cinnamomum micranthum f. kanehirae]|uniref:Uncharacterized protein n=1 Tax=Cinnamomum micranthum f. kanehirae TaxID=337451 RepID=A0A3S3PTA9_9MAGN|nr:hypothetical protein CKAN_02666700 [Cinnamomum micranthum f. kanehirae]